MLGTEEGGLTGTEFCSPGGPVFQLATIRHQLYDSTMLISHYVVFFFV